MSDQERIVAARDFFWQMVEKFDATPTPDQADRLIRQLAEALPPFTKITALSSQGSTPEGDGEVVVRHKKRGTLYTVLGVGRAQGQIADEDPVVIYRGEDGGLWARHQVEFSDGRFEDVSALTAMSQGSAVEAGEGGGE